MPRNGVRGEMTERRMISTLRRRCFDVAVIFTVYSQNPLPAAMLCRMAGIPRRVAHCRENPYGLLTQWLPEPEPDRFVRHEVRRQLDLVAALQWKTRNEHLSLDVPQSAHLRVMELLKELDMKEDDWWVIVHPGASAASRRYPPLHFARVVRELATTTGCRVLLTGAESERGLTERIACESGARATSLAGCLTFGEFAALIACSPLLISNNTAPAHVASAVGTPVVVLYALTNPQHVPWNVQSRVLYCDVPCKGCQRSECPRKHHRCLRGVEPAHVVRAALDLLANEEQAPREMSS
jgi:lipopolysaccharide heptosyltransferase II